MEILNKSFPALEALANLKDLSPMQILRHAANAIVEASEIAQNIQIIRDEVQVLREQVGAANAAWEGALAARDRAINEVEDLKHLAAVNRDSHDGIVANLRTDLETVNEQRLTAAGDALKLEVELKEVQAQLSLTRADLTQAIERGDAIARENASLRNSLTQANDEIGAFRIQINNLNVEIKQTSERLVQALEAKDKAEARLDKIMDVLTA